MISGRKLIVVLIFLFILQFHSQLIFAQSNQNNDVKEERYFSFAFDNDVFFNTDQYYTNGFIFSFSRRKINFNGFENFIYPFYGNNKYFTITISQKIFTPKDFSSNKISYGDYPFSGNLTIAYSVKSFSPLRQIIIESKVETGIIGKYAFGEEVQNGIHSLLPHSSDVPGWEYQISTGLLLNYLIKLQKGFLRIGNFSINGIFLGRLGTPETSASVGFGLIFGKNLIYFNFPFYESKENFDYRLDFSTLVVGRIFNTNLQGNLFSDSSPYVISSINHLLLKMDFGFTAKINNFICELRGYFLSPEFNGGEFHKWGRIKLGYRF